MTSDSLKVGGGVGLLELAARCEAAREPDRPLSWDIWEAVGRPIVDGWSEAGSAPAYTVSLDAAMTLVPEGWEWLGGNSLDFSEPVAWANVRTPGLVAVEADDGYFGAAKAATPALALTAAALRALAARETE